MSASSGRVSANLTNGTGTTYRTAYLHFQLLKHHFDDRHSPRPIALSQNWSAAGDGTCRSSTVMPCFLSM